MRPSTSQAELVDSHNAFTNSRLWEMMQTAPAQSRMATATPPTASRSRKLVTSSRTTIYQTGQHYFPRTAYIFTCGLFHNAAAITTFIFCPPLKLPISLYCAMSPSRPTSSRCFRTARPFVSFEPAPSRDDSRSSNCWTSLVNPFSKSSSRGTIVLNLWSNPRHLTSY